MAILQTVLMGTLVVGAIGSVIFFKKKKDIVDIENLSTDDEKYKINKWIVENAIEKNDKEKLERLLDNENIIKHEDLSKLINEFLSKNKNK